MLEESPVEAVLIPPPAPPEAFSGTLWMLFLLLPAAWLLLRFYQNSRFGRLHRLRRKLRRGKLTPRRAAHHLAVLLHEAAAGKNALTDALDKARFRREEPSRDSILHLIREAESILLPVKNSISRRQRRH